jgi:bloom syndrome protein
MQMINRDKQLSPDQKERQREALRAVLRYCSNKVDCRRTQVLGFFGESFDAKYCNNTCDVCINRVNEPMEMRDVTDRAKIIINLVAAIPDKHTAMKASDSDWTMPQTVECLKGLKGSSGKPLNENPCFGKGASWDRGDHERLFEYLLIENILGENYKENNMGFSNAYMTVSDILYDRYVN